MSTPNNQPHDREERSGTGTLIPHGVFEIAMKWLPIRVYSDDHSQEYVPGSDEILRQ